MFVRPLLGGQQRNRGAVGQRSRVARRHGRVSGLDSENRTQRGQFLNAGVGTQIVVAIQPQKRRDQVVEKTSVVGGGHVAMAGGGQFVLVDAFDPHLFGGDGGVIPHRKPGARLIVGRNLDPQRGGQRAHQPQALHIGLGPAQLQQGPAQVVAQADRRVGRGVHPAGGRYLVTAGGDAVGRRDRRLQTGTARLLQVESRRVGGQLRSQHTFTHQIEIAAVLEHGPAGHHAQLFTGQPESVHQTTEGRREHVLIGRLGVGAVGSRERNAIAAQHGNPLELGPGIRTCRGHLSLRRSPVSSVWVRPSRAILPTVLTLK